MILAEILNECHYEKMTSLLKFQAYQILCLDNLNWYLVNSDQLILLHCHLWLNMFPDIGLIKLCVTK